MDFEANKVKDGGDEVCGYECNICLGLAQDPVITFCGHLYCWYCLIQWLFKSQYSNNECPICKTEIEFSKLIFSYGNMKSDFDPISRFECNICSRLAQDPVITLCGHLYCWPCIYKWLSKWNSNSNCRVCKAAIEENRLIPLYGKGIKSSSHDSGSGSDSRVVVSAGIASSTSLTARSNSFFRSASDATGILFRFGRYAVEIFMTRVVTVVAILFMFNPSMSRERKNYLVEKVFGLSLWSLLILVVWHIFIGKMRRNKKIRALIHI